MVAAVGAVEDGQGVAELGFSVLEAPAAHQQGGPRGGVLGDQEVVRTVQSGSDVHGASGPRLSAVMVASRVRQAAEIVAQGSDRVVITLVDSDVDRKRAVRDAPGTLARRACSKVGPVRGRPAPKTGCAPGTPGPRGCAPGTRVSAAGWSAGGPR